MAVEQPQKTIIAEPPSSFSESELQDFMAYLREGGEVGDAVIDRNVRHAKCLVFLRQGGCLSGIAALKNPLSSYRVGIAEKSGVAISMEEFPFELGYIFVLPSARQQGLASELISAALASAEDKGVFATARANNDKIHRRLTNVGFQKAGAPYKGRQSSIQLFLLPATKIIAPKEAA